MTLAFVNAGRGVDVWIVRGRSWWSERQPRERLLLCGLAVLLALAVIINGIARPLIEVRREARAEIALFDALEVRLRAAGPNLRPPTSTIAGGSLQTVATMTAAEAALPIREIA
ncbi:type II secretion system protein GspM, partial [Brevundimonas sp.]|uniref:type II secretion system protein GspM n=1 Tax=Brevundimonas sp. TaxID=1871086 RepID=UPI0037841713